MSQITTDVRRALNKGWHSGPLQSPCYNSRLSTLVRADTKPGAKTALASKPEFDDRTEEDRVRLRSEAEAPFRSVRVGAYGVGAVASGLGFLTSIPQLIGALGNAPNALPLEQVGTNIAINLSVGVACALALRSELQARDKQMARLTREEKLGALTVTLANGKVLPLSALRGSARCVVVAGTQAQVAKALEAAEPFKESLIKRGVLVIPLPIFGDDSDISALPPMAASELRWRVTPRRLEDWRAWFETQLKFSTKAKPETGLFVGLRLDGRVRSSGMGQPTWQRYALELAPLEGDDRWTGFMDGFDGRV